MVLNSIDKMIFQKQNSARSATLLHDIIHTGYIVANVCVVIEELYVQ
jgi:hypothetical protein